MAEETPDRVKMLENIREHNEQLYANTFENLDKRGNF